MMAGDAGSCHAPARNRGHPLADREAAPEALLRRAFAGDFQALMAWWRIQRHDPALVH